MKEKAKKFWHYHLELIRECFKNFFNPVRHWRQMKEVKSAKKP